MASVTDTTWLIVEPDEDATADRLTRSLEALGVGCRRMDGAEACAALEASAGAPGRRLIASSSAFLRFTDPQGGFRQDRWQGAVHSAFVIPSDADSLAKVTDRIAGVGTISIERARPGDEWEVCAEDRAFSLAMAGVRAPASRSGESMFVLDAEMPGTDHIIAGRRGAGFIRCRFESVPIFVTSADVVDVGTILPAGIFDVREHFLSAVPIVLYVKWALADQCWQAAETCACLVIDDPLLRQRYGFLRFERLLTLMEELDFSTSIAFIPINWDRNSAATVGLFKQHATRFSLCVHGSDHTGGEFGDTDPARMSWRVAQALERMERLSGKTGLAYDPVMVFPQGVFSTAAMRALKHSDFIGAVNTETISADEESPPVTIADYWSVALMNYGEFPLFTRRYPSHGIQNIAFDILLGKPCIIVVHHGDCRYGCREVGAFITQVNSLRAPLRWTGLAELAQRSFRRRFGVNGVCEVEMFASKALIDNPTDHELRVVVRKRESDSGRISEVRANDASCPWRWTDGELSFETLLRPRECRRLTVAFEKVDGSAYGGDSLRHRARAKFRRRLSEFRDNYLSGASYVS